MPESNPPRVEINLAELIKNYIPFISVVTVGYGVVYIFTFYSMFNLNIFQFLEVNEILLQSLKDLVLIVIPAIVILFYGSIYVKQATGNTTDRRSKVIKISRIISIIGGVLSSIQPITELIRGILILENVLYIVIINIGYSLVFLTFKTALKENLTKTERLIKKNFLQILLIGGLCFLALLLGITKAATLKTGFLNEGIAITLNNNKIITSTHQCYYIGRTKSFTFFYNDSSKFVDVYDAKDIKAIKIKYSFPF